MSDRIKLYFNPFSRARIARWMLEEVGAPYDLEPIDFAKGEHKSPKYLAINPMGKLPTLVHRGTVVTEVAAILAYLADAFPQAGLAPPANDPARGTYYRWLFFGASCVDAAVVDRLTQRPVSKPEYTGYGTYESTVATLEKALQPGPFILGERFSAADVYLGAQIGWGTMMKALEPRPVFAQYLERCSARPAYQRANG